MPKSSALSRKDHGIPSHPISARSRRLGPRSTSSVLIAFACLLSAALSACGPSTGDPTSLAKDQVFTWPFDKNVPSINGQVHGEVFDPAAVGTLYDATTTAMIYTSLVTFDGGLNVIGDAATNWDVSGNGTIYTFHLRHDMHFNDGKPLTAADFAYGINRALDPALCTVQDAATYGPKATGECSAVPGDSQPVAAGYLGYILGADKRLNGSGGDANSLISQGDDPNHGLNVVDPYTLRVRLAAPVAFFLEALTYPTSAPIERSLVEKYPNGLWVDHLNEGGCSGPFQIASYNDGKKLTLTPNKYWEQGFGKKLTLTEVDRPLTPNIDEEYSNYRAGLYDYTSVPGKQYTFARGQDDFNEVPTLTTNYIGLDLKRPPFTNVLVRRAFDLALNKQILVDRIYNGGATPSNHIVPRGMPGFNDNLKNPPPDGTQSLTGNQAAAVELLKTAAKACVPSTIPYPDYCDYITGPKLEIDLWTGGSNETRRDLANATVQMWRQVLGLNTKAQFAASFTDLLKMVYTPSTTPQAWTLNWQADYPDPQDWLTLQFHTGYGNNASALSDSGLDALMDRADREQDPKTRMDDYNQVEQEIVKTCAWIPVAQGKLYWRQRRWVHGFGLNPLANMVDVNWPNVYITQH